MRRIDHPTRASSLGLVTPQPYTPTAPGYFDPGDPATGNGEIDNAIVLERQNQRALLRGWDDGENTRWQTIANANADTGETVPHATTETAGIARYATAQEAAEGTVDDAALTSAAAAADLRRRAPSGAVFAFAGQRPPEGALKANGAAMAQDAYGDLDRAIWVGAEANETASWGYRASTPTDPANNRNVHGEYIVLPTCAANSCAAGTTGAAWMRTAHSDRPRPTPSSDMSIT